MSTSEKPREGDTVKIRKNGVKTGEVLHDDFDEPIPRDYFVKVGEGSSTSVKLSDVIEIVERDSDE